MHKKIDWYWYLYTLYVQWHPHLTGKVRRPEAQRPSGRWGARRWQQGLVSWLKRCSNKMGVVGLSCDLILNDTTYIYITQHFPANTKFPKLLMVFIKSSNMTAKTLWEGQNVRKAYQCSHIDCNPKSMGGRLWAVMSFRAMCCASSKW